MNIKKLTLAAIRQRQVVGCQCGWIDLATGYAFEGQPPKSKIKMWWMINRRRLRRFLMV